MNPSTFNLPALIDHTILRPEATRADVLRLCREAKENGFTVIFIPPCYANEAVEGVRQGATVLDMVINIIRLKSGDLDAVREDIAEVVQATPQAEHKVILET